MKKQPVIINTLLIVTCLSCVALTFWGNLKNNGTLTTDAFVGIIATLIGICATIVVGFQIASFLELREVKKQVESVERERKELEQYKASVANELYTARTGVANAFGMLAVLEKGTLSGLAARVSSIVCENLEIVPGDILLTRYQQLYKESQILLESKEYIDDMLPFMNNLNYLVIPKNKDHYNEIMKLHFDVLALVEMVKSK